MLVRFIADLTAVLVSASAFAQLQTDKPMRMIVPFSAGAGTDTLTSIWSRRVVALLSAL